MGVIVAKIPIHHDARILVAEEGNRDGEFQDREIFATGGLLITKFDIDFSWRFNRGQIAYCIWKIGS